eukprot:Unigene13550_Nuclearia_a/m.41040 Unigene13550_Nuclearia_a/g.41040  ORF Unigene13550_Nuclearia_a/g.41040 Unigene13550_Nuclearia_a/m.41040 type:complete len:370 (-) Unigene13550_Nuclearia_a:13-1122(-)
MALRVRLAPSLAQAAQRETAVATQFAFCPRDGRPFLDGERACAWCAASRDPAQFARHADGTSSPASALPSASTLSPTPLPGPPRWRKLLYVAQPFPDNHVDGSFLEELQRNVNVRVYDYWELVRLSGSITQQGSSIVLFAAIFIYAHTGVLSATALVAFAVATTLLGFVYWDWRIRAVDPSLAYPVVQAAQGAVLFFVSLLALSPVLRTLTEHTSSDTVWALTSILFFSNLLLHDYSTVTATNVAKLPGALSLNAAISGSVMLASRLPSTWHVFGLMALAIEWFALFPMFRRYLHLLAPEYSTRITLAMVLLTTALLATLSTTITVLFGASVLFITFVCPYWLLWMQRYKNEIHGPWDEATLTLDMQPE